MRDLSVCCHRAFSRWPWFGFTRNPTLTKQEIENNLREYLGVETVLWLGQGIVGDVDTDGHVDNLLAFVRPGEVSECR